MKHWFTKPASHLEQREIWLGRQSNEHYARQILSLAELAVPIQTIIRQSLSADEAIDWMLFAPFQGNLAQLQKRRYFPVFDFPWEFTPDWILVLTGSQLLLLRFWEAGKFPEAIAIPLENILFWQSGVVLLHAWLDLYWIDQDGIRQETITYNAVSEKLFTRLTEMIRWQLIGQDFSTGVQEAHHREALAGLPYKFTNMIPMRLLLPGEPVRCVLFRPAVWQKSFIFFRKIITPQMALVCTNHHLIIAEEEKTGSEGGYGLIATFLPVSRVCQLFKIWRNDRLYLSIMLTWKGKNKEITIPFPKDMESALSSFMNA